MKLFLFFIKYIKTCIACLRSSTPNCHLLPTERIRIGDMNERLLQLKKDKKEITMEELYQIIGYCNKQYLADNSLENHPAIDQKIYPHDKGVVNTPTANSYICKIKRMVEERQLENYIIIDELPGAFSADEIDQLYNSRCQITIKNLIIYVSNTDQRMFFHHISETTDERESLIHIAFVGNHFTLEPGSGWADIDFTYEKIYLVFKDNHIKNANLALSASDPFKIELTNNVFENSNLNINATHSHQLLPNIVSFEGNIVSDVLFNGNHCYFNGKNTIDSLHLGIKNLYWRGHQNIDPRGNHAHSHKKMFMFLINNAVSPNDLTAQSLLRREILKCDAALIRKEKTVRSLQDKFVLGWSKWVSDYGVSWARPIGWLIVVNAIWATMFHHSLCPSPGWTALFAELFYPLSNVSGEMRGGSAWLSALTVSQKTLLAALYYEIIKIIRRFSK